MVPLLKMGLFKKLFSVPTAAKTDFYFFAVKCSRCGEVIEGRVNLSNDPSLEYEGNRSIYYVRKVLMGEARCFQRIEVELKFNPERNLVDRKVSGGDFVE